MCQNNALCDFLPAAARPLTRSLCYARKLLEVSQPLALEKGAETCYKCKLQ